MEYTEKEKRINAELNKLLPKVYLGALRSAIGGENTDSHYFISPDNFNLSKSKYSYKKELKFIHFTNLFAIQSILTSRTIRLYNLHNLNDPREFSFAGDLLTFNSINKEDAKMNMYILSMCETDILTGPAEYEYNMWRLYGQDGNGICIKLDFSESSPQEYWRDYFLSKIFYGADSRNNLKKVNKLLIKYENEKPKTIIDLGQILAFHKSNLYKLEKEVRLLFDCRKKRLHNATKYIDSEKSLISPIIYSDLTRSISQNKEIKYLELPIFYNNFQKNKDLKKIPIPKIEKIILGHSYKENFKEVADKVSKLAKNSLGYEIKIELSRMAKYYYDK